MDEEENLLDLTEAFWKLAQSVFTRGTMTDVVFWVNEQGNARIAFVGNPLKVAQVFGMLDPSSEGGDPNIKYRIGQSARRDMGIPLSDSDLRHDWGPGQDSLFEVLSRLSGQLVYQWAEAHDAPIGDEGVRVGFIPEPGYPWPASGDRYWSAKRKQWMRSERPGWLIEVEDRDRPGNTVYGVNPCLVFPPDETETSPGGPVCGELPGFSLPVMLTHAMSLPVEGGGYKHVDEAIAGIKNCGGLLFPSLAVGPIPATNFGSVVLVAHLELLLASLAPYRRRGRRPCWVYGTDAWTTTTGQLMTSTAVSLFDELHGDDEWLYNQIATLGVAPETTNPTLGDPTLGVGGHVWVEPLKNTRQLATSLKKRMRGWTPDLTAEEFEAKNMGDTVDTKYAYGEAKAREVVRLDEFPFLIAPSDAKDVVKRFVKGVGYKGKVIFDSAFSAEEMVLDHHVAYLWAWRVAEIVRDLRPVVEIET